MADIVEVSFEEEAKKQDKVKEILKSRTNVELGPFKGIKLEFTATMPANIIIRSYIFILYDGKQCWNGQLTSISKDAINVANKILEKAKKTEKSGQY